MCWNTISSRPRRRESSSSSKRGLLAGISPQRAQSVRGAEDLPDAFLRLFATSAVEPQVFRIIAPLIPKSTFFIPPSVGRRSQAGPASRIANDPDNKNNWFSGLQKLQPGVTCFWRAQCVRGAVEVKVSDLLFNCLRCSKHLVVDERATGRTVNCSECANQMQVPASALHFRCPHCQADLCAPTYSKGQVRHCPKCNDQFTIDPAGPQTLTSKAVDIIFRCPRCSKHVAVDEKGSGRTMLCPDCHNEIQAPAPTVDFTCDSCHAPLKAPPGLEGDVFNCPTCRKAVLIPLSNHRVNDHRQDI
jgi:LSD1 subclass zinc finger protein